MRTAVAYDLFGNGKTALKVNASKYIASAAAGYAANFNGMTYSTQTRAWLDSRRQPVASSMPTATSSSPR